MITEKIYVTEVEIAAANQAAEFSVSADMQAAVITGLAITADANATLEELYETTLASSLNINQQVLFPSGIGARSLYTGNEVCPQDRFWRLNECIRGGEIITGSLINKVSVPVGGYKLKVLVRVEFPQQQQS